MDTIHSVLQKRERPGANEKPEEIDQSDILSATTMDCLVSTLGRVRHKCGSSDIVNCYSQRITTYT